MALEKKCLCGECEKTINQPKDCMCNNGCEIRNGCEKMYCEYKTNLQKKIVTQTPIYKTH